MDRIALFGIRIRFILKTRTYSVFGIRSKFTIRPNTDLNRFQPTFITSLHCSFEIFKYYEMIANSEAGVKLCSRERQRQFLLCSPPAPSDQCGPGVV